MEKVTKKNRKRVKARKKGYQARLLKMKEQILAGTTSTSNPAKNVPSNTSNPTTNVPSNTSNAASNVPSNASNAATTKSTDVYMYGVGLVAIRAVELCVFTPLEVVSHSKLFSKLRIDRRKKFV